jgi:hypothetical protein
MVLALLYIGAVFYSRWSQNRELQREADSKMIEEARRTDQLYGSGQLKILNFYAVPGTIARGGSGELCYGVANAATVRIEPHVEDVKPSLTRCFSIRPAASTTYTLTAADDHGHQESSSAKVVVR